MEVIPQNAWGERHSYGKVPFNGGTIHHNLRLNFAITCDEPKRQCDLGLCNVFASEQGWGDVDWVK